MELRRFFACALLFGALGGCGGGDDVGAQQQTTTIGAAGGTVTESSSGAQVVVPPGALAADTPIAIARDGTGAPALPSGFVSFGPMFAFTPHGTGFTTPVSVTVPFDAAALPTGATPVLYKTNAQGEWERVGSIASAGSVTAQVSSFSFFLVGNLPPQITQQPQDASVVRPATAAFTVTALGTPPFTLRWERSDDGGATFTTVGNGASFTTAATSVAADDGDRYRVVVGNLEGETVSRVATLTVRAAPPPVGGRFTLTVSLSGNFGEVWGFKPTDRQVPSLQCINSPGGPNPCSEPYDTGTPVRLVPMTFTGSVVWTGCDQNNGNNGCIVNMNADRSVTARFQ